MTGRIVRLAGLCALLGVILSVALPVRAAVSITDDRGITVSFDRSPQRIVSLLPSLTETVCALGQCQRLVGVDRYSNFPAAVQRLPQMGGGLDPTIEAIVALRPDAVLMARSSRGGERLEALGLKVVALEPERYADVRRILLAVGQLLEVPAPEQVWRAIDAGVTAAAQSLPAAARGTRVYFEVNAGPYAASEASFIGETLARLGARNIVPGEMGSFPKLNPEFVVRADPDLVMVGEQGAASLSQRPGWPRIRAIREGRVCVFSAEQADILVRPGPRMAEAARLMAGCLASRASAAKGRAP